MRTTAISFSAPLITTIQGLAAAVRGIEALVKEGLTVKSIREYYGEAVGLHWLGMIRIGSGRRLAAGVSAVAWGEFRNVFYPITSNTKTMENRGDRLLRNR